MNSLASGLTSTEILEVLPGETTQWKIFQNSLPYGFYRAKSINLHDQIYLMGNLITSPVIFYNLIYLILLTQEGQDENWNTTKVIQLQTPYH